MKAEKHRALIVDDEMSVRQLTARALNREGFTCETAVDGQEAEKMLHDQQYDVVVTDLRMPNLHGHALAVKILEKDDRPLLIVLTGVSESRLVKDLLIRGVDDVSLKPVDYSHFAAKVAALTERRAKIRPAPPDDDSPARRRKSRETRYAEDNSDLADRASERISLSDIESRLPHVSSILPLSHAALDVFNMASSGRFSAEQIAAATQRDASLAAEVLRLANSSFYNPTGAKITDTEEGVARLGQKRVGEIALATNALAALTTTMLPWMDMDLAWRRSIAAGVAVELLIERGGHADVEDGLLASAIMHDIGRVVLGTLYPSQYDAMIRTCHERRLALFEEEGKIFPENHAEVAARLLAAWSIPPDVFHPLRYVADDYGYLGRLSEPEQTRVELLKLAILVGRLAAGRWEKWDWVEFPPPSLLKRLNIDAIDDVVSQTRDDLEQLVQFEVGDRRKEAAVDSNRNESARRRPVNYCKLRTNGFDFLADILKTSGFRARAVTLEAAQTANAVLINCLGAPSDRLSGINWTGDQRMVRAVAEKTKAEYLADFGEVVYVPTSHAALCAACDAVAAGN